MDYKKKIKMFISIINNMPDVDIINIYELMGLLNISQYAVAKAISELLIRKGILIKKGYTTFMINRGNIKNDN